MNHSFHLFQQCNFFPRQFSHTNWKQSEFFSPGSDSGIFPLPQQPPHRFSCCCTASSHAAGCCGGRRKQPVRLLPTPQLAAQQQKEEERRGAEQQRQPRQFAATQPPSLPGILSSVANWNFFLSINEIHLGLGECSCMTKKRNFLKSYRTGDIIYETSVLLATKCCTLYSRGSLFSQLKNRHIATMELGFSETFDTAESQL